MELYKRKVIDFVLMVNLLFLLIFEGIFRKYNDVFRLRIYYVVYEYRRELIIYGNFL